MTVLPPGIQHTAGAGIYYHVDCKLLRLVGAHVPDVGFPRDYKWINTISLAKSRLEPSGDKLTAPAWEQMNIATSFNTTQIWILNIGDLKMLELPIEHFMSLAYDSPRWPRNSVEEFLKLWAARDFGHEVSHEVADIMSKYSVGMHLFIEKLSSYQLQMYSSRIKAELLNSTLWSFANYDEYVLTV